MTQPFHFLANGANGANGRSSPKTMGGTDDRKRAHREDAPSWVVMGSSAKAEEAV
jgi:hypothetical protein